MPKFDRPACVGRPASRSTISLLVATVLSATLALSACGGSRDPVDGTIVGGDGGSPPAPEPTPTETAPSPGSGEPAVPVVPVAAPVADKAPAGYELVFADEFSGTALDRSRWCTRYAWSGGNLPRQQDPDCIWVDPNGLDWLNDEQQRYVDVNRQGRALHEVSGGYLHLVATRTGFDIKAPYESAMLRSKEIFRADAQTSYYVTSRMRLPKVVGTWPAFWLIPDRHEDGNSAWPPEIDIMEGALNGEEETETMIHLGAKQQNFGGSGLKGKPPILYAAPEIDTEWTNYHSPTSLRERWVEFAVEWAEKSVCFYVDGKKVLCQSYQWLDNQRRLAPPASIIVSFSVGGNWAGRYGVEDAAFPVSFDIDHVRVYRKTVAPAP